MDHNKLWKNLKQMRIPDHLPCLLRNLYASQEAQLEPDMEQWTGLKFRMEYDKAVYCFPAYLTCRVYHVKCWAGWSISWNQDCQEKYQKPQICRWYYPYDWKQSGTKNSLLIEVKEIEKAGLKLSIQKTKIMASGPITSWQIDGETVETVTDFILWGSKITADGDCSHEIKRCLLLGRKAMTNLDSIFKSRELLCQQRSV